MSPFALFIHRNNPPLEIRDHTLPHFSLLPDPVQQSLQLLFLDNIYLPNPAQVLLPIFNIPLLLHSPRGWRLPTSPPHHSLGIPIRFINKRTPSEENRKNHLVRTEGMFRPH